MLALALEGGGARGAYHLGAYKALREFGLEFDCVAGTSIGAVNGAVIAQGDWELLYETWWNITPSQILDIEDERFSELRHLHFSGENAPYFMRKLKEIVLGAGLDTSALKKMLYHLVDEEKLRRSPVGFGLVTFSITDMKPLELYIDEIPAGQLVDYILASAHLPAFRQEKRDGKYFLDGGVYDNLPFRLLERQGYRDIVAIRTGAIGRVRGASRETRVTSVAAGENLGMMMDFDQAQTRYSMRLGYHDAWRVFRAVSGKRYYITLPPDGDEWALDFFLRLPKSAALKAGKALGLKNMPWRNMLLEKLLPHIAAVLGLKKKEGYADLLLAMLELLAEDLQIERFRIYAADEFLRAIAAAARNAPPPDADAGLPPLIRQNEVLARAVGAKAARELVYGLCWDAVRVLAAD
ncbi:MAG: patatin-like phospholipase family protein [Gracilibacteraceae bacterium]|jgi:NTE family protein|nr:patatin-like phospholipase family protein [Gracilibacteraceae bacterium]